MCSAILYGISMPIRILIQPAPGGRSRRPIVRLKVRVQNKSGIISDVEVPFLVDTGASHCIIPIALATTYRIPFNRTPKPERVNTSDGVCIGHKGNVTVYICNKAYYWHCYFTEVSKPPKQTTKQPAKNVTIQTPDNPDDWGDQQEHGKVAQRILLGRSGFLTEFLLTMDCESLVIVKRNWWRRCVHRYIPLFFR